MHAWFKDNERKISENEQNIWNFEELYNITVID